MTDLTFSTTATPNVNASTCEEVANILWSPNPYQDFESFHNTIAIRMAHTGVPRGGASKDILDVIMGTPEQAQDYLVGLSVSSIIILLFFGCWIAMLIVLKCLGTSKVGWLAGRRQPLPKKPTSMVENTQDLVLKHSYNGRIVEEKTILSAPQPPQDVVMEQNKIQHHQNQNQNPQDDMEPVGQHYDVQPPNNGHDDITKTAPTGMTNDNANRCITDSETPNAPHTVEEWNKLHQQKMKQQRSLQATVIVACLVVVIMAIIMATKGVQSLRGSLNYGRNSINYAEGLLNTAAQTVAELAVFLRSFQADMQILLNRTNTICPNIQPLLCENLTDVNTCDTTGVFGTTQEGRDLEQTFQELVEVFYQDWTIVNKLQDFEQDLVDMSATASYAEDQISTFDWVFYIAIAFDVMVGLLALTMIVFLVLPRCRQGWCLQCMHHRCLFPTFIVLVLLSLIFAIAFLIASLVSADTCANDPDQRFLTIATYIMYDDRQPYLNEFVSHWLSQCDAPTSAIDQDEILFQNMYDYVARFEDDIAAVSDWLVENCGTTNPDPLVDVAGSLLGYICVAVGMVWQVKDAFQCSTWWPLYYNTVYNALCYNGVDGVWAIAATQFLTCFMTCVILTCRCVFFDLKIEGEEEKEDNDEKDDLNERVVANRDEAVPSKDEVTDHVRVDQKEDENYDEKAGMKIEKVLAVRGDDEVVADSDDGAVQVIVEEEDKKGQEKNEKAGTKI